jgi:hypothetical protein
LRSGQSRYARALLLKHAKSLKNIPPKTGSFTARFNDSVSGLRYPVHDGPPKKAYLKREPLLPSQLSGQGQEVKGKI